MTTYADALQEKLRFSRRIVLVAMLLFFASVASELAADNPISFLAGIVGFLIVGARVFYLQARLKGQVCNENLGQLFEPGKTRYCPYCAQDLDASILDRGRLRSFILFMSDRFPVPATVVAPVPPFPARGC